MRTEYPYQPDMEHCKMIVRTDEATCYIMDDCIMSPEQQARAERNIVRMYRQAMLRQMQGNSGEG